MKMPVGRRVRMGAVTEESTYPAWHQALAYAVTGQSLPDLGRQRRPDVPALAAQLEELAANRDIDLTWSAADAELPRPARSDGGHRCRPVLGRAG